MPEATKTRARNGQNGQKAAPVQPRSFVAASRKNDKPDFEQSIALTTGEQRLNQYQISPSGYLRGVYITAELTAVNTTVTTVAYNEDGPFNVFSSLRFLDTNSQPMIGTLTGYDVYILNKYGGYRFMGDPKCPVGFSSTAGTTTSAGTFAFTLFLPLEIVPRNALGSQLNKSGAAQFQLEMFVAATTTVYSTPPATSSTLRVRCTLASWLDPEATDAQGNPVMQDPPLLNTTQYWHKQNYVINSGAQFTRLQGIDGLVRMLIFIARRSASTRTNGESDWPDPFSIKYEESFLIQSRIRLLFRTLIGQHYGFTGANEAFMGRDNGVYPIFEFMMDFGLNIGNELGREYLPMSSASNLEVQGTWGNAVSLDLLVNKIVPFPQGEIRGLGVI
jgi:hypothetical protein